MRILLPTLFLLFACGSSVQISEEANLHLLRAARALETHARTRDTTVLDIAESETRVALEYAPHSAAARTTLGLILMERGERERAERELRVALEIDPDFDEAWANLGVLELSRARLRSAAECFEAALAIDPSRIAARTNLAKLWLDLEEFEQARAQWMRVLTFELERPERAEALAWLAYSELRLSSMDAAHARVHRAAELAPTSHSVRFVRGLIYAHRGSLHSALADLQFAARNPAYERASIVRQIAIYLAMGDDESAAPLLARLEESEETSVIMEYFREQ